MKQQKIKQQKIKQQKGFLDGLWDNARGVFKDWTDWEKFKFEKNISEDRWKFQRQLETSQAPQRSGWSNPAGVAPRSGIPTTALVVGGLAAVGIVVFVVSR